MARQKLPSPENWDLSDSVIHRWTILGAAPSASRKGLRTLIILVCWEIWKETNARTF
ncbi:hypothetical protein PAHAL_1G074900 [Panicum hallii]|uniref:Uncharacterized protein n=1 Tax=Panicum hallii TaxID=206008 RepID=A0A2T8KUC6_9POAL|nr:hypothetical protein PAHAL_1G074900 [Panicum hallii]